MTYLDLSDNPLDRDGNNCLTLDGLRTLTSMISHTPKIKTIKVRDCALWDAPRAPTDAADTYPCMQMPPSPTTPSQLARCGLCDDAVILVCDTVARMSHVQVHNRFASLAAV